MKNWLLLLITLIGFVNVNAQSELPEDLKLQFYKAFLSSNISLWESGIAELEKSYQSNSSDATLLEIIKAKNGLVGSCFAKQQMDKAKAVVESVDDQVNKLLKKQPDWAEVKAIKGGLLGYKIGFSPMKGMWLGPKSSKYIEKAIKGDTNLPRAWYQKAMSAYQTPPAFGGDLAGAIEYFSKAVSLFEKEGNCLDNNWEYLNALAWLGQAQTKAKQYADAKTTYQKALEVEPLFGWVEYALLPNLEKQMLASKE